MSLFYLFYLLSKNELLIIYFFHRKIITVAILAQDYLENKLFAMPVRFSNTAR